MYIYTHTHIYIYPSTRKINKIYTPFIFSSKSVPLMRKLKMYIIPIYFQIAMFFKTGEYIHVIYIILQRFFE